MKTIYNNVEDLIYTAAKNGITTTISPEPILDAVKVTFSYEGNSFSNLISKDHLDCAHSDEEKADALLNMLKYTLFKLIRYPYDSIGGKL